MRWCVGLRRCSSLRAHGPINVRLTATSNLLAYKFFTCRCPVWKAHPTRLRPCRCGQPQSRFRRAGKLELRITRLAGLVAMIDYLAELGLPRLPIRRETPCRLVAAMEAIHQYEERCEQLVTGLLQIPCPSMASPIRLALPGGPQPLQ